MKANKTTSRRRVSNHRRRKDKESDRSTDSVAYNQTLKQQKQLNGRNHHIAMSLKVNRLNSPIKTHCLANCIKKEDPTICCIQEIHFIDKNKHYKA
jgi:hypothetical protein